MQLLFQDFQQNKQAIGQERATLPDQNVPSDGSDFANPAMAALLSEDIILQTHWALTHGTLLSSRCGVFREGDVHASSFFFSSSLHFYPSLEPATIAARVDGILANLHEMLYCLPPLTSPSCVQLVFKLAAWLLFHFVDLHPFADGNGRMCRLLANRVLCLITPFPVAPFPSADSVQSSTLSTTLYKMNPVTNKMESAHVSREASSVSDYYWAAIEQCRYGSASGQYAMSDLAALLVENAWQQWLSLESDMQQRFGQDISKTFIGEMTVIEPPDKRRGDAGFYRPSRDTVVQEGYKRLNHHYRSPAPSNEELTEEVERLLVKIDAAFTSLPEAVQRLEFTPAEHVFCWVHLKRRQRVS